jgi:putative membrane protein
MDTKLLATLLVGASIGAVAQPSQTTPTTPARSVPSSPMANGSGLARSDVKFIEEAAKGGLAEVELGKLGQKQAQDPAVKDFAARMVKDHSAANNSLTRIADAKRVVLPSTIDKSHQKDIDKLAKKSGADFDKAYMDHLLKDHKKDVKEFQKASKDANDPDVKSFAAKTLSTLEGHLQLAERTEHAVKGKPEAGSPEKAAK